MTNDSMSGPSRREVEEADWVAIEKEELSDWYVGDFIAKLVVLLLFITFF